MSLLPVKRQRPPWMPWARAGLALTLLGIAGWGLLELGHRYLGLQKLVVEQVTVTGCRGERLAEVQRIAEEICLGKPLFWVDAEGLRTRIEAKRWVRGLLIRKDPPDRLSLVVEERKPLLWLVRQGGTYLVGEDGILLDKVNPGNLAPIPVVADPASQTDEALVGLIRVAIQLRDKQAGFFDRITELRWSDRGPVAFIEGFQAPIYLSRVNPTNNIPNFQAIYVDKLMKRSDFDRLQYVDLRWGNDDYVTVGGEDPTPPAEKSGR
jgi:hypothetical protein